MHRDRFSSQYEPIGLPIFPLAVIGTGMIGIVAYLAINAFRNDDTHAPRIYVPLAGFPSLDSAEPRTADFYVNGLKTTMQVSRNRPTRVAYSQ